MTVLSNHAAFIDSIDFLHVVGEVRNDSDSNAELIEVAVALYNAQNQPVANKTTFVILDTLVPGDKSCFNGLFLSNPNYSYYQFATDYDSTVNLPRPLTILNDNGIYNNTFGWLDVVGQIRNDGVETESFPQIVGTLYDTSGRVLDCRLTFSVADELEVNQTSIWDLSFTQVPQSNIGSYRVQPN